MAETLTHIQSKVRSPTCPATGTPWCCMVGAGMQFAQVHLRCGPNWQLRHQRRVIAQAALIVWMCTGHWTLPKIVYDDEEGCALRQAPSEGIGGSDHLALAHPRYDAAQEVAVRSGQHAILDGPPVLVSRVVGNVCQLRAGAPVHAWYATTCASLPACLQARLGRPGVAHWLTSASHCP